MVPLFGDDNFWWNLGQKIENAKFNVQTSSIYTDAEESKWGLKCFFKKHFGSDKGTWVWNESQKHYEYVE